MGVKFGFEESGLISQGVSQTHFDPSLNPTDSVIECGDTFIPLMDRGFKVVNILFKKQNWPCPLVWKMIL